MPQWLKRCLRASACTFRCSAWLRTTGTAPARWDYGPGHEIGIQASEPVFALIGQIQEETHRFAVTYHHQRHTKNAYHSALDDVPGIGPARKKQLLKAFWNHPGYPGSG